MSGVQRERRLRKAEAIIAIYEGTKDQQGSIVDAITDLMHYAKEHNLSFLDAASLAQMHFLNEKE